MPQNPERPEPFSQLSPYRLFDRMVASAGGGAHPMLCEHGDAGKRAAS
jgi:hypothetical protein